METVYHRVAFKRCVNGLNGHLGEQWLQVTMVVSLRILELMSCVMNLELDINSQPSTLHNQMALLRGRIEHSLIWQGLCL